MNKTKGLFIFFCVFFLLGILFTINDSIAACTPRVKIADQTYTYTPVSIQDAYNYAINDLGLDNFTLQLSGEIFEGGLTLDGGALVVLEGGYDCTFASKDSATPTSINGTITIRSGTVKFAGGVNVSASLSNCTFDADLDGYTSIDSCSGSKDDCDDNDPSINPGAVDYLGDLIDQDCDGRDITYYPGYNEADCLGCHGGSYAINNLLHQSVTAPDSTCINCHANQVNAVLPGHYGNTVQTPDNNMATGDTIICISCHDYHDPGTGYSINGTGDVWSRVSATWMGDPTNAYVDLTCDTCHLNRENAHSNITHPIEVGASDLSAGTSCSSCHVVDNWTETEGTEHNVPTNGDGSCATCHNSPRQDVMDVIANGSAPINCLDCHADKTVSHGNVDHVALGYVTGSGTSCLNCHDPGTAENATVTVTHMENCALCHITVPDLQSGLPTGADVNNPNLCTDCHGYIWDDLHSTSCLSCHNQVQDNQDGIPLNGRRAVEAEFPTDTAHAHFANPGALTNTDCLVCHNLTNHTDGFVKLSDADTGTLYEFQIASDLTNDPDISDFCMSCHDSDGATQLALPHDPFANGNTVPDVATKFMGTLKWNEWYGDFCFGYEGSERPVNSHHDISDADQAFSGAKIECLDCHGAHTSADSQKVNNPFVKNEAWAGTLNEFCLSCHNGEHEANNPNMPAEVTIPTFYSEPPPEVPGVNCGTDMVYDCAGTCVAQTAVDVNLANASCDDYGTLDLDCSAFSFDGGDCQPVNTPNTTCDTDKIWDCADNCVDQVAVFVGDPDALDPEGLPAPIPALIGGTCDEVLGLDLNCAEFNYDYNACNPCIGNNCSSVGGIDSCDYDFAPWWIEVAWQNTPHGGDSKRDWPGYSGAPTVPEMDCVVCHDSHGSYDATTNPAGNPYMFRDFVEGSQFLDDSARSLGNPQPWNPGTDGPVVITNPDDGMMLGNQLCIKCHASWEASYSWHNYCTGCLTCHSHGAAWGVNDWNGAPTDTQWCP